jgi:flavin-dependent dehydrogenase
VVLGPLATDTPHPGRAGLLLMGDAAGFNDPMTRDGIHLALQSAAVAAETVSGVLDGRLEAGTAHAPYARALRRRVWRKRLFNRALRELVGSPGALRVAATAARAWPAAMQSVIRYAGDAGLP